MKFSPKILKELESIGYFLVKNSNPPRFHNDGGQFCGGYWEVSEKEALESLENIRGMNKLWIKEFGKKYNSGVE